MVGGVSGGALVDAVGVCGRAVWCRGRQRMLWCAIADTLRDAVAGVLLYGSGSW